MQNKFKNWMIWMVALSVASIVAVISFVAIVDPYFHYHKPLSIFSYTLENQRYQNDGILKHFDYDAIITGSSMTENFRPSELDALFNVNAIKVPFAGGSFREVNDNLETAFKYNDSIKMIVRGLDYNRLFDKSEDRDYDSYPVYMYDNNILNDVFYTLNIDVVFVALQDLIGKSAEGERKIDFDAYSQQKADNLGKVAVDWGYSRNSMEVATEQRHVTDEEYETIKENIEKNVLSLAKEHPETDFYLYFTPYSIAYIDYYYRSGNLVRQMEAEKYIIEMLLPYENIKLYSFFLQEDVITDMNNYRDTAHHAAPVNSMILQWMHDGIGLITVDNYEEYCQDEYEFFMNFDYDEYFKDWD